MKHGMKRKRNLRMSLAKNSKNSTLNPLQILNMLIAQEVPSVDPCTRRHDGTSKPRMVICKFTSYKTKEAILKKARRIKPKGVNIFEYLPEEKMEKRRAHLSQLRSKPNPNPNPNTNPNPNNDSNNNP